jgi:hypothetical protein
MPEHIDAERARSFASIAGHDDVVVCADVLEDHPADPVAVEVVLADRVRRLPPRLLRHAADKDLGVVDVSVQSGHRIARLA